MSDNKAVFPSFPSFLDVLVQSDLDDLHKEYCTDRECVALRHVSQESEGISLHAPCHPTAALELSYLEGTLCVWCDKCGDHVATIAIARTHICSLKSKRLRELSSAQRSACA